MRMRAPPSSGASSMCSSPPWSPDQGVHDVETESLPARAGVAARAPEQHRLAVRRGDAGAVVIDAQLQPVPVAVQAHSDTRTGVPDGVVQDIAQQLEQRPGLDAQAALLPQRRHQLHAVLLGDPPQCRAGTLDHRRQGHRRLEGRRPKALGLVQLVLDHALHAFDLQQQLRPIGFAPLQPKAQCRKGGLQTVREIRQRVLLALQAVTLELEQGIDTVRQCLDLARVGAAEAAVLALAQRLEIGAHTAQGPQAPETQRQCLPRDQQYGEQAQRAPQRASVALHLRLEGIAFLQHLEGQRKDLIRQFPLDGHATLEEPVLTPFPQRRAERRGRAPEGFARTVQDARIKPSAGQRQAGLREHVGELQLARAGHLDDPHQQQQLGVQAGGHGVFGILAESALEQRRGQQEEDGDHRGRHQADAQPQTEARRGHAPSLRESSAGCSVNR
jgi:hypothetical protein